MLCFHIGLPKTATTFLQWEVLPWLEPAELIHKSHGGAHDRQWLRGLKRYCNTGRRKRWWLRRRWQVRGIRGRLRSGSAVIVSSENLSMRPDAVWTGRGPGPETVSVRLAEAAGELGVSARQVKILFGLRAQAPWLASRYAESAKSNPDFGQADFAARIGAIADGTARGAPLGWLNYAHVYDTLAEVFGAENLLFLPIEAVERMSASDCAGRIAGFLGLPDAPRASAELSGTPRRNVSARAEGTWRLKSGNGHIALTSEMESAIRARFASANAGLKQRIDLDLGGSFSTP